MPIRHSLTIFVGTFIPTICRAMMEVNEE